MRGKKIYGGDWNVMQSYGCAPFSMCDQTDRVYLDHLGQIGQLYFCAFLAEHEAADRRQDAFIRRVGICWEYWHLRGKKLC